MQRTICNGKRNPIEDLVDFTALGAGVQMLPVLAADAFSFTTLADLHVYLYLNNLECQSSVFPAATQHIFTYLYIFHFKTSMRKANLVRMQTFLFVEIK